MNTANDEYREVLLAEYAERLPPPLNLSLQRVLCARADPAEEHAFVSDIDAVVRFDLVAPDELTENNTGSSLLVTEIRDTQRAREDTKLAVAASNANVVALKTEHARLRSVKMDQERTMGDLKRLMDALDDNQVDLTTFRQRTFARSHRALENVNRTVGEMQEMMDLYRSALDVVV